MRLSKTSKEAKFNADYHEYVRRVDTLRRALRAVIVPSMKKLETRGLRLYRYANLHALTGIKNVRAKTDYAVGMADMTREMRGIVARLGERPR